MIPSFQVVVIAKANRKSTQLPDKICQKSVFRRDILYRIDTVVDGLHNCRDMREQTDKEEMANSVTHGVGIIMSVAALAILVTMASMKGDAWKIVSFSIYGSALLALYLASTLYHVVQSPRIKHFFQLADHSAIFLLIAGTYTPFTLVSLNGPWGWTLFGLIWGFAITGIVLTFFFLGRFRLLFTLLYLGMGWLVVIAIKPLWAAIQLEGMLWIISGGVLYSLGVIFYLRKNMLYSHTIWHLFVLAGSSLHFFGVYYHVLPS